ncbi:MAG TPA: hypothetical protein VGJ00_03340 [Rhabdochlamydiaceae bacterium]|jgi:hypothetical protein
MTQYFRNPNFSITQTTQASFSSAHPGQETVFSSALPEGEEEERPYNVENHAVCTL